MEGSSPRPPSLLLPGARALAQNRSYPLPAGVTFEEPLWRGLHDQVGLLRVLVRKGVLSNEEVPEEIKAVRWEVQGRRRGIPVPCPGHVRKCTETDPSINTILGEDLL